MKGKEVKQYISVGQDSVLRGLNLPNISIENYFEGDILISMSDWFTQLSHFLYFL